jgi:ABC-type dipeptide/oligopeptide/nickel transport system ATPase subunit
MPALNPRWRVKDIIAEPIRELEAAQDQGRDRQIASIELLEDSSA